ncbi:MAG: FecR domain-containing protein [Proteobacteria bacterium]|nr:FecR domain-containing protein [Pseudomonadota bacterium]
MKTTMPRSLAARLAPLALLLALGALAARADDAVDPPGRVARVNLALGEVSMQPAGADSWVSDVANRPLTNGDKVWSDRESRVEIHVGSSAVRLGGETGLGILNVDDRTVQLKLSAGTLEARVRALGPEQTFEIATPTASVSVLRPGDYRVEVDESSGALSVSVARGQAAVTDQGHETTVEAGQRAEYAAGDVGDAQLGSLPAGDAFDQWVAERDRREDRASATRYVSREMVGYEDLDDNGRWQTVDEYGPVWVPAVAVGWAPYRYGHWGWVAPWGWTWIDDAPWGFAPFHYGRWLYFGGHWCWAPGPRRVAPVYAPALVGWVGGAHWGVGISLGGPPVGWFPLGWNEVYVPGYRVSDGYVRNVNVTNIHVNTTVVNNYIVNNTTIVNGVRTERNDRGPDERRWSNAGVAGAVTATDRATFTGAKPVGSHFAQLPKGALERAELRGSAPAIAPAAQSLGRPVAAPRAPTELLNRPVVARTAPPPPPPSFEAQRSAIVANGGRPVMMRGLATDRGTRHEAPANRPDVIRVGPSAPPAVRGERARPGTTPVAPRPVPASRAADDRPPSAQRPADRLPPPAVRGRDDRPAAESRPPPESRPAPRAVPDYRPPAESRSAPEYRAPSRPAPESRPPAESRAAPAPRPAPEARPAPEYRPAPAPRPPPEARPAPEYRPAPAPRPAPEARPAQEFRPPPAPPHESRPPPPPPPRNEVRNEVRNEARGEPRGKPDPHDRR